MKFLFRVCLALTLVALTGNFASAQGGTPDKTKILSKMLESNSPVGRDFWLAVPPNDPNNGGYWNIEFYVTSKFNTMVSVENPGTGLKINKPVTANGTAIFTFGPEAELQESETITEKGYHIYSKDPISVYVLNTRPTTSDGFMALPTNVLGKDYIHVAHYEFNDFGSEPRFGTGFIVTATEDGTKVRFHLRGKGNPKTFKNGWGLNTQREVTLNQGQTYMLRTVGNTSNVNDITGTSISTTKPVSVVSFHMRANFPSGVQTGSRDCLSEMIPPTQSWGKRFVTTPFATSSDKGDMYRVIASQNDTEVFVKVYDKSGKLTKIKQTLLDKGEFAEWDNPSTLSQPQSINGPAYWEASKPVLIMQYAMSQSYYSDGNYDPDMVIIPPIDQYIQGTVFQTPPGDRFATNWFYLYAVGDSTDANYTKLKTIMLDDKPVWKNFPTLLFNRVPGTNVYWVYIKVTPGPHYIESDTKFGGIINGFSSVDGYTWPAAMAVNKIDVLDTLPPVLSKTEECGVWSIEATEYRTYGKETDSVRQVDQGVNAIEILDSVNYGNYTIKLPLTGDLPSEPKAKQVKFVFEPIDKSKDARLIYIVRDAAGNISQDTITYIADKLTFTPDPFDFKKVRIKTTKDGKVTLTNPSGQILKIKEIKFKDGQFFGIKDPKALTEIGPNGSTELDIEYSPKETNFSMEDKPANKNYDSLIVETDCGRFALSVFGWPVAPRIKVGDLAFGTFVFGAEKSCNNKSGNETVIVENTGNTTLNIDDRFVDFIKTNGGLFSLENPTLSAPIKIEPGEINRRMLKTACFMPTTGGAHKLLVTFNSDAVEGDSISEWTANVVNTSVAISDFTWLQKRVNTVNTATVEITNGGDLDIVVQGLHYADPATGGTGKIFEYESGNVNGVTIKKGAAPITVTVKFSPDKVAAAGSMKNNLIVEYKKLDASGILQPGTFYTTSDGTFNGTPEGGNLIGGAYQPEITTENAIFATPVKITETSTEKRSIVVTNTSDVEVFIHRIEWNTPSQTDFEWANPVAGDKNVAARDITIPVGASRQFEVIFHPVSALGQLKENVNVVADIGPSITRVEGDRTSINTPAYAQGEAFGGALSVRGHDWGRVLACNNPEGFIEITNTGEELMIDEPKFEDKPDAAAFNWDASFPLKINGGTETNPGTTRIKFFFRPSESKRYNVTFSFMAPDGIRRQALLEGEGYAVPVTFSLGNMQGAPGEEKTLDLMIKNENAADADIKSFTAVIALGRQLKLTSDRGITSLAGWNFNLAQQFAGTNSTITITASGPTALPANGTIASIPVQILLFDPGTGIQDGKGIFSFEPQLPKEDISVNDRKNCVIISSEPGLVEVGSCFIVARPIKMIGDFNLMDISPNPASGSEITIGYEVAFPAHTRVDVINSMGEIVRVINDGELSNGRYSQVLDATSLSSGQYTVRMFCGPYVEARQFIITK